MDMGCSFVYSHRIYILSSALFPSSYTTMSVNGRNGKSAGAVLLSRCRVTLLWSWYGFFVGEAHKKTIPTPVLLHRHSRGAYNTGWNWAVMVIAPFRCFIPVQGSV